jgi:hypothetical protein
VNAKDFNPKVSIVIPVYNGSDYLEEAIESALNQTYKNIEVIIVNDGSNDNGKTEAIAQSFGDRIAYFFKENGGVASALNYGSKQMTGDFYSWLSHDDVYYPNKIEKQVKYLQRTEDKDVVLYSDFEIIDANSHSTDSYRVPSTFRTNPFLSIISTSIHGCSTLLSKDLLDYVGLFNEDLKTTQDNDLWFRIYKAGFRFEHLPEILIKSRCHPAQGQILLSSINKVEMIEFYRRVFMEAYDTIITNADKVFDILKNKCVNLPLSIVRRPRKVGDGIPPTKVFRYKVSVLLRIVISKLRQMKPW